MTIDPTVDPRQSQNGRLGLQGSGIHADGAEDFKGATKLIQGTPLKDRYSFFLSRHVGAERTSVLLRADEHILAEQKEIWGE